MDSTHDDKHTTPNEAPDDASQSQFLAALLAASQEGAPSNADREPVAEDGIALSSSPDEIELPGASAGSPDARSETPTISKKPEIMYSIERNFTPNDDEPIEDEVEEMVSKNEEPTEADFNLFLLACPKCDGELALREEHIGVEGACVWCKAPIVAGRSGADRTLKVFAIASDEELKAEMASTEPAMMEEEKTPSAPVEDLFPVAFTEVPTAAPDDPIAAGWGAPSPFAEASIAEEPFSAADFHIPADEKTAASEEVEAEEPTPGAEFGLPVDLAPANELEEPAIESEAEVFGGFSAKELPSADEISSEKSYSGSGFGEFLSSASGTVDKTPSDDLAVPETTPESAQVPTEEFSSSTPWGPPSKPATSEPETAPEVAPAAFSNPNVDADPAPTFSPVETEATPEVAPAGFLSPEIETESTPTFSLAETEPTSEPAPTGFSSPEVDADPAPTFSPVETEATPEPEPTGFSSPEVDAEPTPAFTPFETEKAPEPAPTDNFSAPMAWGAPDDSASPAVADSDTAPSAPAGFGDSPFGSPALCDDAPIAFSDQQPDMTPEPAPEFGALFSQAAPKQDDTKKVNEDIPVGFNIPANGSPSSPFQSFSSPDEPPAPVEAPVEPSIPAAETKKEELPAPAFDTPASEAPLFGIPGTSSSSLFGNTPEAAPTPIEQTPANPFGSDGPPAAAEPATTKEAPAPAPNTPQVESVTLGKKKKRKGFFIIAVVVLGLVCGAALASFVLPVDQYVGRARSLMEKKFMPSTTWESAQTTPAPAKPTEPPVRVEN